MKVIATPEDMAPLLKRKAIENLFFRKHLRGFSSVAIDRHVHDLAREWEQQIDCLACANCCKKLEPGIEPEEAERLAAAKQMSIETFKETYVAYDGDAYYLRQKPCMFLEGCACSIYTERPAACAGYPHLDQSDMKHRRTFWENYHVCPIVFNVLESLKERLGFTYP